ncbi:MAG: conjugative transposon protein TraM [Ginsengibacter sp.]
MDKVKQSQNLRKRKMMLVLPVLVIPFITLAFWALGGGKGTDLHDVKDPTGLNLHLPDPKIKAKVLDKLGFYDEADRDSSKLKQEMKADPYYQDRSLADTNSSDELESIEKRSAGKFHQASPDINYQGGSGKAEEKLMQKLNQLKEVINQPQDEKVPDYPGTDEDFQADSKINGRLNRLMQSMNENDSDPELDKLSGMMDKIIAIQHPDQVKENHVRSTERPVVFTVSNQSPADSSVNGFYGLDAPDEAGKSNAIEAVVNEDQELVSGSIIKLRLLDDAYIGEVRVPAGSFVFGTVALQKERLNVTMNSIRVGNSIYPVKMQVYDMDGMEGIYIPGAINRDVARQSADNNLQTMQLTSMDPSLTAQATAAGISTAKNLLSRKMKMEKVMVKAGYKVLLKSLKN